MAMKEMYRPREKNCAWIALGFYFSFMIALTLMGYLMSKGFSWYPLLYLFFVAVAVTIVLVRERSLQSLGLSKKNLKIDGSISLAIFVLAWVARLLISDASPATLTYDAVYYFFYIAFVEELLFRGLLQTYLFGFRLKKPWLLILGGVLFALMHLPFQMFRHNNVSFGYVIDALPQLLITFIFHMVLSIIADKRGNILIPTALHYFWNYFVNAL